MCRFEQEIVETMHFSRKIKIIMSKTRITKTRLIPVLLVVIVIVAVVAAACSKTATISFDCGEGANGSISEIKVKISKEITIPDATGLSKKGYIFECWSYGSKNYNPGDKFVVKEDVTFTAIWTSILQSTIETYSLTYNLGKYAAVGETAPATIVYEVGTTVILAEAPKAAEGYEFVGWHDGTKTRDVGASYTMPRYSVTMTAQWKQVKVDSGDEPKLSGKLVDYVGEYGFESLSDARNNVFTAWGNEFFKLKLFWNNESDSFMLTIYYNSTAWNVTPRSLCGIKLASVEADNQEIAANGVNGTVSLIFTCDESGNKIVKLTCADMSVIWNEIKEKDVIDIDAITGAWSNDSGSTVIISTNGVTDTYVATIVVDGKDFIKLRRTSDGTGLVGYTASNDELVIRVDTDTVTVGSTVYTNRMHIEYADFLDFVGTWTEIGGKKRTLVVNSINSVNFDDTSIEAQEIIGEYLILSRDSGFFILINVENNLEGVFVCYGAESEKVAFESYSLNDGTFLNAAGTNEIASIVGDIHKLVFKGNAMTVYDENGDYLAKFSIVWTDNIGTGQWERGDILINVDGDTVEIVFNNDYIDVDYHYTFTKEGVTVGSPLDGYQGEWKGKVFIDGDRFDTIKIVGESISIFANGIEIQWTVEQIDTSGYFVVVTFCNSSTTSCYYGTLTFVSATTMIVDIADSNDEAVFTLNGEQATACEWSDLFGEYTGENEGISYSVVITRSKVLLTIGDEAVDVKIVAFDSTRMFVLYVNGVEYTLVTIDDGLQLQLQSKDINVCLSKVVECLWTDYLGTWQGNNNGKIYKIIITVYGVRVFINNQEVNVMYEFDMFGFTLNIDGAEYYLRGYSFSPPYDKLLFEAEDDDIYFTLDRID